MSAKANSATVALAAKKILEAGLNRDVTDIKITPGKGGALIQFQVGGSISMIDISKVPRVDFEPLANHFCDEAGMLPPWWKFLVPRLTEGAFNVPHNGTSRHCRLTRVYSSPKLLTISLV